MICLSRPYLFKSFKGCLPQILLGPFLNTLPHLYDPLYRGHKFNVDKTRIWPSSAYQWISCFVSLVEVRQSFHVFFHLHAIYMYFFLLVSIYWSNFTFQINLFANCWKLFVRNVLRKAYLVKIIVRQYNNGKQALNA